jgi:hypothetical protein
MKDDDTFFAGLNKSREVAELVCQWLKRKGYDVTHPPQKTRPRNVPIEERWRYTDDGDLEIKLNGEIKRIEVKYRPEMAFRSGNDIPYHEIIVDEQYKIDGAHTYPLLAYIIVDKTKRCAMMITEKTKDYWYASTKFDRKEQEERTFCMCPKEHCLFFNLRV